MQRIDKILVLQAIQPLFPLHGTSAQDDWAAVFDDLDDINFSGKTVAYMGTGEQVGYADNFMDAMGQLEEKIASLGGKTVGYWPTDGYEHEQKRYKPKSVRRNHNGDQRCLKYLTCRALMMNAFIEARRP